MNIPKYLLVLLSTFSLVHGSVRVNFGTLDFQMRSQNESDPADLVGTMLVSVVGFLTDTFRDNFATFEQVRFTVNHFDVASDGAQGFLGAVAVEGTVSFDAGVNDDVPSPTDIALVASNAFQEYDQEFLDDLARFTDNPFLAGINFVLVKVNGVPATTGVSPLKTVVVEKEPLLQTWVIALIAGLGTFVLVFCVCMTWLCCCTGDEEQSNQETMGKTESRGTASASENGSVAEVPMSTRSFTSQASSRFTYNPSSNRGSQHPANDFSVDESSDNDENDEGNNDGSPGHSNISRWLRESNKPLPTRKEDVSISFGQDISEIQNEKDLSLIEEEADEEETPEKDISHVYLSRSALESVRKDHANKKQVPPSLLEQSEDSLNMTGSTGDVIQELNDLSYQISMLRKGGR